LAPVGRRRLLGGAAALAAAALTDGLAPATGRAQIAPPPITPQPLPTFVRRTIAVTDAGATLQRTFLVHLPLLVPAQQTPMPAVIVFHGGGQTADAMIQHWQSLIAPYNFVIVLPQALVDPMTNSTRWLHARPGDLAVPTTDLAFVDALLDWLAATGDVDMERVYASGFSSGACMTWQLAMLDDFVGRFRGFAPVAHEGFHLVKTALGDPAALATPKPLIYTHGTADPNWSEVVNDEQQLLPTDVVTRWIARNRSLAAASPQVYACAAERPVDPIAVEQLYLPDPAVASSAAICFLTMVNHSHCWPLTGSDPTGRGLVCRDIDATRRIVAFWNTYAGMGLPSSPAWRMC
jgi:polyhydroxybutyrate depolymerase